MNIKLFTKIAALVLSAAITANLCSCTWFCKHEYDMQNPVEVVDSTCTEAGYAKYECVKCGYIGTAEREAKGHDPVVDARIEPTCIKLGQTEGMHCARCGEIFTPTYDIPMTDHTPVQYPEVTPTCTEDGYSGGEYCIICKKELSPRKTLPAEHNFVTVPQVDATCSKDGQTAKVYCTKCGYVQSGGNLIPATKHTYDERGYCTKCGKAYNHPRFTAPADTTFSADGYTYKVSNFRILGYTNTSVTISYYITQLSGPTNSSNVKFRIMIGDGSWWYRSEYASGRASECSCQLSFRTDYTEGKNYQLTIKGGW